MSSHSARRGVIAAAVAAVTAFGLALAPAHAGDPGPAAANPVTTDGASGSASIDRSTAIVVLDGDPLAVHPRTKPATGKRVNLGASVVRSVRETLAMKQADFGRWLERNAPAAAVTRNFDVALNAVAVRLDGTTLDDLRSAPGVVDARYATTYRMMDAADPQLNLIRAIDAWSTARVGGGATAGDGIKVGVIDSGIDHNHPCFDDAGYPETTQVGDTRFTNNKVIAARAFSDDPALTAEAINAHGTHVAGTVACNLDTPASVHDADVPYQVSGVAPRALVGNYNVFPGDIPEVTDADLLDAMEAAFLDGMDVINLSLGGEVPAGFDPIATAVNNLDEANVVVAVAAGNSGPGHSTVSSPGVAERALTAGASTVGHFVGAPVTVGDVVYPSATGDFELVASELTAPLGVVPGGNNGLAEACDPLTEDLTGAIAVVSRGTCTFSTKVRHAEDAGAVATLVVNAVAGDPTAMGTDESVQPAPTIPAYMLARDAAADLIAEDGTDATIGPDLSYFRSGNDNIMAGFSSQGPSPDRVARAKPDVVAPGVNVLSSVPLADCDGASCWAFNQGTSMASPHLAGMAAVLRKVHPSWTAEQIRSAIVNTATEGTLTSFTDGATVETDVNIIGTGRADLLAAVDATIAVGPVSTTFGTMRSRRPVEATVTLTNLSAQARTLSLSIDRQHGEGMTFTAPQSVTVPGDDSVRITLTAQRDTGRPDRGHHSALLRLSDGGTEVARSVLFAVVS